MAVTSVRLQADVEQALTRTADRQRRSKSWVINQAVREYVQRQATEDERWQQTLTALDDVAAGRVLPAKAVHAWLSTWGTLDETAAPKGGRWRRGSGAWFTPHPQWRTSSACGRSLPSMILRARGALQPISFGASRFCATHR